MPLLKRLRLLHRPKWPWQTNVGECRMQVVCFLPLGILGVEEALKDSDDLVESGEVDAQLGVDLLGVRAELGVKVLAVRAGAHGGAEDGLDEEAVVGLQGGAVGGSERVGELLAGLVDVLAKGDAGELEATNQPEETLGGGVLLGLELVADKVLDVLGLEGSGEMALSELLDIAENVVLDGRKGNGAKGIKHGSKGLGRIEELGGGDGVGLLGIDRHSGEAGLEGVEQGATGGNSNSGHDG
jgi:hypothetical protein